MDDEIITVETRTLKNGAVVDAKTGKIVAMPALDRDTAREMVRAREEKRIRLYTEGAQMATERADMVRKYGADAHIVERGYTMQKLAATLDAGKAAVMAAQHLDKAQGLVSDVKQSADAGQMSPLELAMASLIEAVTSKVRQSGVDVIDAETSE